VKRTKPKKSGGFMKLNVIFCIAILLVGTAFFMYSFFVLQLEPVVLEGFFYGAFITQLLNLTRIKKAKIKSCPTCETEVAESTADTTQQ